MTVQASRVTASPVVASSRRLRALWAEGRPAYGVWSSLADPAVAELLAGSAFDYVCVDLQHGLATYSELPQLLQAMRAAGRAPVVRVPWNTPDAVMRALDTGAAAVVVPMVSSPQEARQAATWCRFPPHGSRSWGPMWGAVRPDGALPPGEQDAAALCLVMVETAGAVESLDEMLAVPGVDGVYVGPNDLALDCGFGRATYRDDRELDRLLQRVVDTCRQAGLAAGLHCSDPAMAREWASRGATMLTVADDLGLLRHAVARTWDAVAAPSGGPEPPA